MQFSAVLFALATASSAYAVDQVVKVGDNGSLAFSPTSLNVQAGDNVIFEFRAKNHSVTQSSFANPCSPLLGGSDSGFQPVNTTTGPFPQWNITISNTSAPFWFYCAQTNPIVHCHSGMVFAINPTADKSFGAFQANANASASAASTSLPDPTGIASGALGAVSPGVQSSSTPTAATFSDGSLPSETSTGGAAPTNNGAVHMAASASGSLALAGLVVGLMF